MAKKKSSGPSNSFIPGYTPPPSGSGVGGGPNVVTPSDRPQYVPPPSPVPPVITIPDDARTLPGPADSGAPPSPPASPSLPPPPPPPSPTPPDPWIRTSNYVEAKGVKQAEPDTILFNQDAVSPELLLELQFEDLAGMELINISRSDMIDGQDVVYSPVKQLSRLRQKFNPNNIIALPELSSSFFSKYAIDLILRGIYRPYFDENGDLVIEIDDIRESEEIEVEVDSAGTINEMEFL